MVTEDYVSFETAKLLKEKGFEGENRDWYNMEGFIEEIGVDDGIDPTAHEDIFNNVIAAPTLQMAMKWLREVHNYDVCVCLDSYVEPFRNDYYIVIRRRKDKYENISPCEQIFFKTYEEACEAGIKYCLENLI